MKLSKHGKQDAENPHNRYLLTFWTMDAGQVRSCEALNLLDSEQIPYSIPIQYRPSK